MNYFVHELTSRFMHLILKQDANESRQQYQLLMHVFIINHQTSLSTNQQQSTNRWTNSIHQALLLLMGTLGNIGSVGNKNQSSNWQLQKRTSRRKNLSPVFFYLVQDHKVDKFITLSLFHGKEKVLTTMLLYINSKTFAFLDKT